MKTRVGEKNSRQRRSKPTADRHLIIWHVKRCCASWRQTANACCCCALLDVERVLDIQYNDTDIGRNLRALEKTRPAGVPGRCAMVMSACDRCSTMYRHVIWCWTTGRARMKVRCEFFEDNFTRYSETPHAGRRRFPGASEAGIEVMVVTCAVFLRGSDVDRCAKACRMRRARRRRVGIRVQ